MRLNTKVTTQCPQCGGQFDVSMAQLQLRKGFVRCVHCAHIFDGYETVVPENGEVQMPEHPAVIRQRHTIASSAHVPDHEDAVFVISDPPPIPEQHAPVLSLGDDAAAPLPHASSEVIYAERRTPPTPVPATLPEFLEEIKPHDWRFWCWSVLSVLALLLLLVQTAVIYRMQIASQYPAARPLLTRLCNAWGCQVEHPRRLDQIAVLSSSLRMQPRRDQSQDTDTRLLLHVTLRNQDERAQQWPALLLDLTDFSGAVVIRKHLHPADYLPQHLVGQAFAGRSELALQLPMAVQGVTVNGYQIKPFFP